MQKSQITIILGCILAVGSLSMASSDINRQRMNRDLRIMEGVLDKLFQGRESHAFWNGETRALHVPEYGVIFHTSRHGPMLYGADIRLEHFRDNIRIISERVRDNAERLQNLDEDEEAVRAAEEARDGLENIDLEFIRESGFEDTPPEKIIEKEKESLDSFKEKIALFFENYASAIGQLDPDDRIAVLINLKDWEMTDTESAFLTSWARKRDIDSYRAGELDADRFQQAIHFELAESESDIDMDISILTEILDRALDASSHAMTSKSGLYLSGLGAVLFLEMPGLHILRMDSETPVSVIVSDRIHRTVGRGYHPWEEKEEVSHEERLEEIREELFDLMASYGHTLRILPKDRILLDVNLDDDFLYWGSGKREPSRLLLQLRKEDVDRYNKRLMTREELRSRLISHPL